MTLSRHNLGEAIPADLPEEFSEILARGKNVRIERIVSRGHASEPGFWYDQDEEEFVLVVSGKARLEFTQDPEPMVLGPGDWLVIRVLSVSVYDRLRLWWYVLVGRHDY